MKRLAISLVFCFAFLEGLPGRARSSGELLAPQSVFSQDSATSDRFLPEQLDNLLAAIALYPDPLLAQVLLAATFADQVDEAARWLRDGNEPSAIDAQPWDVSVKAVAHYPSVLYMMSDQLDWTTALGQAYVYQSTDVMISVQRLRSLARSAGNLTTTDQHEVNVTGDNIEIYPARPEVIYAPSYDPRLAYFGLAPANFIFFGPPLPIGPWLNHGCDWRRRRIYYHGWRGGGWIGRSRPIIHITPVYVNSRLANVQINRNVAGRQLNFSDLNRYNTIHRDVTYSNLTRLNRPSAAGAENQATKRKAESSETKIESRRTSSPGKEPVARPYKTPPAQPSAKSVPQPPTRPSKEAQPGSQPPAKEPKGGAIQGSRVDPNAAAPRNYASRARMHSPPANFPSIPPNGFRPIAPASGGR